MMNTKKVKIEITAPMNYAQYLKNHLEEEHPKTLGNIKIKKKS